MSDKRKLREALSSILHSGLVALRGTAGSDADYVRIEANHLHNVPFCIARMRHDDIRYYYNVERPRYLTALRHLGGQANSPSYRDHWAAIRSHLMQVRNSRPQLRCRRH